MTQVKEINHPTIHVPIHFDQLAEGVKQLTPQERATLEILLNDEFSEELLKHAGEMPRLIQQKKTLTHEYLKKKYA